MQLCSRWDKSLSSLLNALTKHLGKRLVFERSPRDAEDRDTYGVAEGGDVADRNLLQHARRPLDEASLRRVAGVLVRLAGQAQYAKVYAAQNSRSSPACFDRRCMSGLSGICGITAIILPMLSIIS